MKYTVRREAIGDLATLVEFVMSEAREAEGIDQTRDNVSRGVKTGLQDSAIARYWVLENDRSEVVGSISAVKEWSDWNGGYYWWIQSMFIDPEHRGKGLMMLLMDAVRRAAKGERAVELRLYVHSGNERAIRAYHKEGFRDSSYRIMMLGL